MWTPSFHNSFLSTFRKYRKSYDVMLMVLLLLLLCRTCSDAGLGSLRFCWCWTRGLGRASLQQWGWGRWWWRSGCCSALQQWGWGWWGGVLPVLQLADSVLVCFAQYMSVPQQRGLHRRVAQRAAQLTRTTVSGVRRVHALIALRRTLLLPHQAPQILLVHHLLLPLLQGSHLRRLVAGGWRASPAALCMCVCVWCSSTRRRYNAFLQSTAFKSPQRKHISFTKHVLYLFH